MSLRELRDTNTVVRGLIVLGGNCLGGNCLGGSFPGGGGDCPGGSCPRIKYEPWRNKYIQACG